MKTDTDRRTPRGFEVELLPLLTASLAERQEAAAPGRSHRSPVRRGRRLAVMLAATAVVVGGTAATAALLVQDPQPPEDLERAVLQLFGDGQCVSGAEAMNRVRDQLDVLGYGDWTVTLAPGVGPEGCVTPGFVASDNVVVLVPVDHPEVVTAMQGVREQLMTRCFSEQEARELISSLLNGMGMTNWEIRMDGPLAYPMGEEEAVRNHIAAGCFVYSGSGRGPDGSTYYISGPEK